VACKVYYTFSEVYPTGDNHHDEESKEEYTTVEYAEKNKYQGGGER
jgi:hypothetical protein